MSPRQRVVTETRQRFNQAVRRHLRDETRLHLTSGGERGDERDVRAVRVAVTAGIPEELEDQQFDDGLALALALAPLTRLLEEAHVGLSSLIPPVARLYDREDFVDAFADVGPTLKEARDSIAEMLKEASRANNWHGFDQSELGKEEVAIWGPLGPGFGAYLTK